MKITKKYFIIILAVFVMSSCVSNINSPGISRVSKQESDQHPAQTATPVKEWEATNKKETAHFIFYYDDRDKKCVDNLANILESNFSKVTKDLNYSDVRDKIIVEIYPNIKLFRKAIGRINSPDWMVGTAELDKIQIVSPLNPGPVHNYDSILKVGIHEFTHIIINKIRKRYFLIPVWLNEGIAVYEANQMDEKGRKLISDKVKNNEIPSFEKLENNFNDVSGYQFSYTLVEFIIKKYGINKLNEFIREPIMTPQNFEKFFNLSKDQFWDEWVQYLKKNY